MAKNNTNFMQHSEDSSSAGKGNRNIEINEIRLSFITNFFGKEPLRASMQDVYDMTGDIELKQKTERIRSLRAISDDEGQSMSMRTKSQKEADKLKKDTPVIFPNVLLEGGKTRKSIQSFNPLLAFDIDHISYERVEEIMDILKNNPYVVFAQPSSSRKGIHGILYVDCDDFLNQNWDGSHADAHLYVWKQMQQYVNTLLEAEIDECCKNPEHSFALCSDPLTYFNPKAEQLHIDTSGFNVSRAKKKGKEDLPFGPNNHKASLCDVVNRIEKELKFKGHVPEKGRNNYVFCFAASANLFGVEEDEVLAYCIKRFEADDFTSDEIQSAIKSAYKKESKHGSRSSKVRYATPNETMSYIEGYGEWRYNELTSAYEVKTNGESAFRQCLDEDFNEIYRMAFMDSLLAPVKQLETLVHSMHTRRYNPILEFRDSLPACTIDEEGKCMVEGRTEAHDYISEIADRLHTTSSVDEVRKYFKKWLVQMVKSWINVEEVNQIVFGLLGDQGKYKTTFFQKLLPTELQKDYFDIKESNGQFTKDEIIKFSYILLIVLEELDSMNPKEQNQIKAVVSQKQTNVRPPYGRHNIQRARVSSFAFTGNNHEILNDPTGSRRFIPFWVESIDSPFDNPIDYVALYAQAFKLAEEGSGFISYIPSEDTQALNERNQEFTINIIEHELVDKYLCKPSDRNPGVNEAGGIITAYLQQFAGKAILDVRKVTAYLRSEKYHEGRNKKNKYFTVVHVK